MVFQEGKNVPHGLAHSASFEDGQAQLANMRIERHRQCQDEQTDAFTLLQWWMENDIPLSPAQMDAYFHQLTFPGVRAVLQVEEEAM